MITIFIILAIAIAIGLLYWRAECDCERPGIGGFFWPFGIVNLIGLIILCAIWCASYSSYVKQRTFFDGVCEQYAGAVEMYANYAEIDIKVAALTDFKYQGYQENVAAFIRDLRYKITNYNEGVISKRVMKKNPFFNWLIVVPDKDMVAITMKGAMEKSTQ